MTDAATFQRAVDELRSQGDAAAIVRNWQETHARGAGKFADIIAIRALVLLRDTERAAAVLSEVDPIYPGDFYLAVLRYEIQLAEGDCLRAYHTLLDATRLDPKHSTTLYRAARLAIQMREFNVATDLLERALTLFFTDGFSRESVFPLACLLRFYAMTGPKSAPILAKTLDLLRSKGHRPFNEISPFLVRAASATGDFDTPLRLGRITTDGRARIIYQQRATSPVRIAGYDEILRDFSQYHLKLDQAVFSASFGSVWTDDTCFAIDHGFHSSQSRSEFDAESKTILTHDLALRGFSLGENLIYLDSSRPIKELHADVLIMPPCHHVNFGHFMDDILALKYGFDRLRQDCPDLKPVLLRPFANAIFKILFEVCFGSDYILLDDPSGNYRVRSAHLLSLPHAMWPAGAEICVEPIRYLVRHLRAAMEVPKVGQRRIFIARKSAAPGDIAHLYREVFAGFRFEAVFLEDLSTSEYFATMGGATHIAGLHGAGLMNFPLAPAGVRVAECRRAGGNWHSIATFANAAGQDFNTFDLHSAEPSDIETLRRQVAEWLALQPDGLLLP